MNFFGEKTFSITSRNLQVIAKLVITGVIRVEEASIREMLLEAKANNSMAREKLINLYREDITAFSSSVCGRPLDWKNDDELSIGLIAFNEAIDNFELHKGMKFWNYARMVIHRRLIDYFRREARWKQRAVVSLEDEDVMVKQETRQSWESFMREESSRELAAMVASFQESLAEFKISLDALIKSSPKHRDTKINLMKTALTIKENPELLQKLMRKKRLPIKELRKLTGQSRKVLESGRKYIIALVLILTREEFGPMRNFINFPEAESEVTAGEKYAGNCY
ncbi:MAG: RNA polymerase sigma-I factor [Thermoanaerobacteraceae bacterium]|nr:RNA polymerase sigma-I factor [Thermoanaerobacteraceae bacterium]